MALRKLVIAGASNPGSIRLVNAINAQSPTWDLIGFVDDDPRKWENDFCGFPVLGPIDLLSASKYRDVYATCFIYGGSVLTRQKVVERMCNTNIRFASLIHPAISLEGVSVGEDCVVQESSILQYGARIGHHCILSVGVSIGHDSVLEDLVFCSPRTTVVGRARIQRGATLGAGCVIKDVKVGENAMVGMGAIVFSNVPDRCTVVGNPARVVVRDSVKNRHAL
jgi:sugar O-acyltransferase (sialic acid O-acetyltransferase NeuD family)